MKILIFNTLYYPNLVGGAERSVQALAESLVERGNDVTVVSTTPKSNTYSDVVNGVKVYYIKTRNIYWGFDKNTNPTFKRVIWHTIDSYNYTLKNTLKKILQLEKPDIVHTNNLSGMSVIVWKLANEFGSSIVHTLRDYYLLCPNVTMFKKGINCNEQCASCKMFSKPKKKLSLLVSTLIGISKFIKDKHINSGYFSNIKFGKVIGNDVGNFMLSRKKPFNGNNIVFGYLGQLNNSKGILELLLIFKDLSKYSNWKLFVAGTGKIDYVKYLKEQFESSKVIFKGKVEKSDFLSEIDVLIVPSLWEEPFGRVVIEGIKHGVYVIGSNRGGISELLIEEDLYEPNSIELKEKIVEILESRTIPKQVNEFNVDVTSEYISIYKKLLYT